MRMASLRLWETLRPSSLLMDTSKTEVSFYYVRECKASAHINKVDAKSNEITAIPELLELLELAGSLVTIDAMGCQKKIASAILKKEADYLLAVKSDQKKLYGELTRTFEQLWQDNPEDAPDPEFAEQEGKSHGRREHRRCWVINDIAEGSNASDWQAKTIAAVQLDSQKKDKGSTLIRYFISSRELSSEEVLEATGNTG